jgi:hypothetical protein
MVMTHHRRHASSGQHRSQGSADALARGLGWFSIALGLAEVLAPRRLTRVLGMRGHENLVRVYGFREIATGIGILASQDPKPWIWGRVGGDALDAATLAGALGSDNPKRENVGLAMGAVAGVAALDLYCAQALSAEEEQARQPTVDYSDRSGLPRAPDQMRGAARDFEVPADMRAPEALRPWTETRAAQRA